VHPTGGLVMMIAGGAVAVGGAILAGAFAAERSSANSNYMTVEQTISQNAQKDGLNQTGLCNNPPSRYASACSTLQSDANAVNQDATVANFGVAAIVVGALVAVGGVVWWIAGAKRTGNAPTSSITPWVGPNLTGGSFRITF
jgi:hypothetical protein